MVCSLKIQLHSFLFLALDDYIKLSITKYNIIDSKHVLSLN